LDIVALDIVAKVVSHLVIPDIASGSSYVVFACTATRCDIIVALRLICGSPTTCGITAAISYVGIDSVGLAKRIVNVATGICSFLTLLGGHRLEPVCLGAGVLSLCGHGVCLGLLAIQFSSPLGCLLSDLLGASATRRSPAIH